MVGALVLAVAAMAVDERNEVAGLVRRPPRRKSEDLRKIRAQLTPDADTMVIVLVGLPARGKSFISKKLERYLSWRGDAVRIDGLGAQRRFNGKKGRVLGELGEGAAHRVKVALPDGQSLAVRRSNLAKVADAAPADKKRD